MIDHEPWYEQLGKLLIFVACAAIVTLLALLIIGCLIYLTKWTYLEIGKL